MALMAGLHSFFFNKNIVFPAQDEYSYFSANFRLNIYTLYSCIILKLWHVTFPFCNVLGYQLFQVFSFQNCIPLHSAHAPSLSEVKMSCQTSPGHFGLKKAFLTGKTYNKILLYCINLQILNTQNYILSKTLAFNQSLCLKYSETCIKRTPSIKRTVAEVPKFISLI